MKPAALRSVLKLGLTGGIGSGKSTVAGLLQQRGASLIDADAISRNCTQPGGAAIDAVQKRFGPSFIAPDGGMDRQRMREHVFAHPAARQTLEAIVHPLVAAEIERLAHRSSSGCHVYDIPLLVESPRWRPQLDRIVVVDCRTETQIRRVSLRNGWDRPAIEAVLASQSTREKRLGAADEVIFNDGDQIEALEQLVDAFANRLGL